MRFNVFYVFLSAQGKFSCFYLYLTIIKEIDGSPSKKMVIKTTECGNPFTHCLDYLAKKLQEKGILDNMAKRNIDALREIRDSSVHFYNRSQLFSLRLQEVGSACLKNFVQASKDWFNTDLTGYNFYLMPLAFIGGKGNRNEKAIKKT